MSIDIQVLKKTFKVLYFAAAKDATGLTNEVIPFPEESEDPISVPRLFEILEARHPKLKEKKILGSAAVAVNLEYVEVSDGRINAGDEVAIIPPVSGG